jgi:hypothetical protein
MFWYIIVLVVLFIIGYVIHGIRTGKKLGEIQMAYVGKYVYDNLLDDLQRKYVASTAQKNLIRYFGQGSLENENDRVRYIFYALSMWELQIDHGLKNYQWFYVKNPFLTQFYKEHLWKSAMEMLEREYGISIDIPRQRPYLP